MDSDRERVEAATAEMPQREAQQQRKRRSETLRNNPIAETLRWVAMGGTPSPVELDELAQQAIDGSEHSSLTFAELRRSLRDSSAKIAATFADGQRGEARSMARDATAQLIDKLGDYTPPPTEASREMDPAKLAAQVPRF